ncbi:hypothetical protein ABZV24_37305 [Streptomyces sp. NPDC005251]|uniref:hypothetical protein n=1 Tax=Streptomyces sp. NPDC005251 TaxID=3157166 RepID=UPI0033B925E2
MKANRSVWAVATCLVAVFVVSCGGGDGANRSVPGKRSRVAPATSSASPDCSKAAIRWGEVTVGRKLIAVSQLVTVEDGRKPGWVELAPHHVRTVTSRIEAGGTGVPARRVLASLEKRLGYDSPTFKRPGTSTSARLEKEELGRVDFLGHPGRFVEAAGVGVVDASFALDCSGTNGATVTPVYGTLTSWYGNSGASMKCGIVPDKGKWFREAYDMVCPGAHS